MSDNKINILLVDDRTENLLALEAILDNDDYQLIKATSGEEALKFLLKYDFAAILLDVQMPGMDGFKTASIIKAREKTRHIPILFITANHLDQEHVFTGYSIGAIDYILKPVDALVLKVKVEGFVHLYKLNDQLKQQKNLLEEKNRLLEASYLELSEKSTKLKESEALTNVIFNTSMDTMLILDGDGTLLKVNPAFSTMFLYKAEEVVGTKIRDYFNNESHLFQLANNYEQFLNISPTKENKLIVNAVKKDGTIFPVGIQIGRKFVNEKNIIAVTIRDMTSQQEYEKQITHMAYHDYLTGLQNRRFFEKNLQEQMEVSIEQNESFALMYIDIDRFQSVNNSLGQRIGDELLQLIVQRINNSVPNELTIYRVGGDKFAVFLSNRETAIEIAEKLLTTFHSPFLVHYYEIYVTASIGISIFPYDATNAQDLVKNANAALYQAKREGMDNYQLYHSGLNLQTYRKFMMQNDLRKALERNQLIVHYQPRYDLQEKQMMSVEALVRWNHPDWGLIYPGEFIPIAEETGMIGQIGKWVVEAVCKQWNEWVEKGLPPVKISVNFSGQQFLHKNMEEEMKSIIKEQEVDPTYLEFEITESTLMSNQSAVLKMLNSFRDMGIKISIDDFGTGYSSLSYLRKYPVDIIKIDKSFVQDHSVESRALITAIITLASQLKMKVVVEGVETNEQWEAMKAMNCDEIQGYYFSRPLPPIELEQFYVRKLEGENTRKVEVQKEVTVIPQDETDNELLVNALAKNKLTFSLSARELEVLTLVVKGFTNKEISEELFISEHTVKNHITKIFQKLNVNDRLQAMAKIYQSFLELEKTR